VFDDFLGSLFSGFGGGGRTDRKLKRILERGETLEGIVDAFKITVNGDESHWCGVRVQGPTGEFRKSVRQQLTPFTERAPLGTPVLVRHLNGDIVVDWPNTLRRMGIEPPGDPTPVAGRTTKEPLPPGIHDERLDLKRLRTGHHTTATLLGFEQSQALGMPTMNWHLDLRLADGRDLHVKRHFVPPYAQHLLVEGATLALAVDAKKPDKVQVDWAGMAEAAAGISA
jgi:hypothetical protein